MRVKAIFAAVLGLAFAASSAEASSIALQVSDGTNTFTIFDNGAGDLDGTDGLIVWSGTFSSGWNVAVGVGQGEDLFGTGSMDLGYVASSTSGTTADLTFTFTQYDLTQTWPGYQMLIGGTSNGTTLTYSAYTGSSAFDTANLIGTLGPTLTPGYTETLTASATTGSPFSLTQVVTISPTSTGLATASGNAELNPVPEPGSLLLLGGGLLGLAGLARRRMRAARS